MGFIKCSEEEAKTFADYLLASGCWMSVRTSQWEAYRFKKTKPMTEGDKAYSPYDTIVINKNKEGVHSFDPTHLGAFKESLLEVISDNVRKGLEHTVGKPMADLMYGVGIDKGADSGSRLVIDFPDFLKMIKGTKMEGHAMEVTLSIPVEVARDLGLLKDEGVNDG
jgi:hypothetical protein